MKIDLHVHCREYSFCGRSSADEQVQAAMTAGLDALVFADHDHLFPEDHLQTLNKKYAPFKIFSGIEITEYTGEHILVLGVRDASLEFERWNYTDLYHFVQNWGGFLALNHPFRFTSEIEIEYERFLPHAVEAYSNNISPHLQPRILKLAQNIGVNVLSNSDSHHRDDIGRYYNELEKTPETEEELIELLKAGSFSCVAPSHPLR
ncbi:hypothetical protein CSA56_02260 [candidate division KSB3 bacterium]|uniref:PHP domain-containing protein n=1 Tax=candidate division KSB3 bacterium TaxID=2044937 RepID=A0A2G6KKI3_9BACT|nr:MAG: hypothetical protein CSA56_02260 [candidate division KSB3 bacterium]